MPKFTFRKMFQDPAPPNAVDPYAVADQNAMIAEELRKRSMTGDRFVGMPSKGQQLGIGLAQLGEALIARQSAKYAKKQKEGADAATVTAMNAGIDQLLPGAQTVDSLNPDAMTSTEDAGAAALKQQLAAGDPRQGNQVITQALLQQKLKAMDPSQGDYASGSNGLIYDRRTGKVSREPDPAGVSGGNSADMQLFSYIKQAHPEYNEQQVLEAARGYKETFTNAERAGVGGVVGNRSGEFKPQTNIATVASNAGDVKQAEAAGGIAGKEGETRAWAGPAAKVALEGFMALNNETVAKIANIRDDPNLWRSTGVMSLIPSVWGGGAADLDASIDTLKATVGFDRLQEMRNNSPTGGALGNVSNAEGAWLQNATQSLKQSQSRQQYIENLNLILDHMKGVNDRLQKAYEADYGSAAKRGSASPPARPSGQSAAERAKALGL